jgi:hypothetical protein
MTRAPCKPCPANAAAYSQHGCARCGLSALPAAAHVQLSTDVQLSAGAGHDAARQDEAHASRPVLVHCEVYVPLLSPGRRRSRQPKLVRLPVCDTRRRKREDVRTPSRCADICRKKRCSIKTLLMDNCAAECKSAGQLCAESISKVPERGYQHATHVAFIAAQILRGWSSTTPQQARVAHAEPMLVYKNACRRVALLQIPGCGDGQCFALSVVCEDCPQHVDLAMRRRSTAHKLPHGGWAPSQCS